MAGTGVEDTNWGSAQPLRGTIFKSEEGHQPVDTVIPVAESQPGGCRLKAGSKFLSGDNVRASGGQAACLILGTHRTLGFPAGLRSACVPSKDSGCLWQGPGPLPNMLTAKAAAQPSCVSHQAGHTRKACLPAVPAVCWLAFVHAASKKVHGTSLPNARPLCQPCHAMHCGLHGLLPGNEGPDLLLSITQVPCQGES